MVDCPIYEDKSDEIEEWRSILSSMFEIDKGIIKIPLYVDGKIRYTPNNTVIGELKLEDILHPKYSTFELVSKIIKLDIDNCGCPSLASAQSSTYDNMLMLKAAIVNVIDVDTYTIWQQRFNSKF
jgi:hypothetical protein